MPLRICHTEFNPEKVHPLLAKWARERHDSTNPGGHQIFPKFYLQSTAMRGSTSGKAYRPQASGSQCWCTKAQPKGDAQITGWRIKLLLLLSINSLSLSSQ